MKNTKDNWIKAFDREIYPELKYYGTKAVSLLIKDFISQVEKDAIEKTDKGWRERIEKRKNVLKKLIIKFDLDIDKHRLEELNQLEEIKV